MNWALEKSVKNTKGSFKVKIGTRRGLRENLTLIKHKNNKMKLKEN